MHSYCSRQDESICRNADDKQTEMNVYNPFTSVQWHLHVWSQIHNHHAAADKI